MDIAEPLLSVAGLTVDLGSQSVLANCSFSLFPGDLLCVLGPNGVGKTTLFRAILGLTKIACGEVRVAGVQTSRMKRRELARIIGYVPQHHVPPFPFQVEDVVLMGRTAHLGAFSSPQKADRLIAEESLALLGIGQLRKRIYTELSGGEQQLVLIARALAQQPRLLVMDEPTANLDFGNQTRLLEQVSRLAAGDLGIIISSHNPNHALQYATKVALLKERRVLHSGSPACVLTEERLTEIYGIPVKVVDVPLGKDRAVSVTLPVRL